MKKLIVGLVAVIVLIAAAVGVGNWLNDQNRQPEPPAAEAPSGPDTADTEGRVNPPGCVGWEVIATPGTWESNADDDPFAPHATPMSLLRNVTEPLQQQFPAEQVKVWTTPYTAQFRNIGAMQEMTYDDSRQEGYDKVWAEMAATHEACPATKFVLVGFSQGAVISGDMASEIGAGRGPVPAGLVDSVHLIADGRQEREVGNLIVSQEITGVGTEISLQPVNKLVQAIVPGATMRGPRPGGFGELNSRVNNYCAPSDLVCDAPVGADALGRARDLFDANAIHAQYHINRDLFPDGRTVPEYIVGVISDKINAG